MKMTVLVLSFFVLTASAFAQYGGNYGYRSAEPMIFHSPEHPAHADFAPIKSETSLYPGTSYTFAQGERAPSDFPQAATASLGDIAREFKKQHALLKKSTTVWVNE
ncbi:MAG: hypothetical protein ACRD3Q_07925 [Terriglobales bacterium]